MPRRPVLTRDAVLDAALALADAEGLDAVSMRAVAARLGVTPMALYRHVGDKEALLDGLVESLLAEVRVPDAAVPWWDRLELQAADLRAVARRHPSAFGLLLARPATSGALRARDAVLVSLAEAGVPEADVPRLERVLSTFVLGFAASEVAGRFPAGGRADADFDYALRLLRGMVDLARGPGDAGGPAVSGGSAG